jgi:hypothetical protein
MSPQGDGCAVEERNTYTADVEDADDAVAVGQAD